MLKGQLDEVLVRRLKSDIRALEGGFPKRTLVPVDIEGLPSDAPELVLARMLDAYRLERENRLKDETRSKQAAGALVIGGLQKRLLSSIEAFAKTLAVHRKSVERALERATEAIAVSAELQANLERLTVGEEPSDGSVGTTFMTPTQTHETPEFDLLTRRSQVADGQGRGLVPSLVAPSVIAVNRDMRKFLAIDAHAMTLDWNKEALCHPPPHPDQPINGWGIR